MQLPLISSTCSDKQAERFIAAVTIIEEAVNAGTIRNAVYNDVKETISRVIDKAWDKLIEDKFGMSNWWNLSKEDKELYDSVRVYGLHDVVSASKKVAKSSVQSEMSNTMREFCKEALPLAEAVKSLKNKIVKGREPSIVVKEVNPNQVRKTCPCCFRQIAVVNNTMVHHGYERPGNGWQTNSCIAAKQFKPLEDSNEGLIFLIAKVTTYLAGVQELYDNRNENNILYFTKRVKTDSGYKNQLIPIHRGDEKWDHEYKVWSSKLKNEISSLKNEIIYLNKILVEWDAKRGADGKIV